MPVWSLIGALAAAVCFGLATVLQAVGMRRASSLAKAVLTLPMIAGVGLDLLGFVFELGALRHLPLFLVQAAVASSLAVTAIAAAAVIGERLALHGTGWRWALCVLGLLRWGLRQGLRVLRGRRRGFTGRLPAHWSCLRCLAPLACAAGIGLS